MARLKTIGFEVAIAPFGSSALDVDGRIWSGTPVLDTAVKRTGGRALKCPSGATNSWETTYAIGGSTRCHHRIYFLVDGLPLTTATIASAGPSTGAVWNVVLTSAGKLRLVVSNGGAQVGSDSVATIETGKWYRMDLTAEMNSGAAEFAALYLDGILVASETAERTVTVAGPKFQFGHLSVAGNFNLWGDDYALNDGNTAIPPYGPPGPGEVYLLKPVSDVQAGSWTGGGGGTTNLWDALDNVPPVGVATPGTNTSQVRTADSSGDNSTDELRVLTDTYASLGIAANYEFRIVQPFLIHGEEVGTGTKNGSLGATANPVITPSAFVYGADAGAVGTYPTNWRSTMIPVTVAPSVDVSQGVTLSLRKTDSGTRFATVCFLAAYVEVRPVAFEARYNSQDLAEIEGDFQRSDLGATDNELADAIWRGGLNNWSNITPITEDGDPDVRVVPIVARAAGAVVTINDMADLAGRLETTHGGSVHNGAIKKDVVNTATVF